MSFTSIFLLIATGGGSIDRACRLNIFPCEYDFEGGHATIS
ncbi:hypothetical protein ACVW1A_001156 [Bradyrhizobium sp. LB1.3]